MNYNSLVTRTLSGIVMLVIVIGAVLLSPLTLALLLMVITSFSQREFLSLATTPSVRPMLNYPVFVGLFTVAISFFVTIDVLDVKFLALPLFAFFAIFVISLYRRQSNPLLCLSVELLSVIYIAVPMSMILFIGMGHAPIVVLMYIFTVWINDVGAYLVGVTIGKHRLFERISPKKSWEGFFGGFIMAVLLSGWAGYFYFDKMLLWAILGALISVSAVFGDLVESMIKRNAGVKDSGASIPGHGGFLDRFDAMFLSAPVVYMYMLFFDLF